MLAQSWNNAPLRLWVILPLAAPEHACAPRMLETRCTPCPSWAGSVVWGPRSHGLSGPSSSRSYCCPPYTPDFRGQGPGQTPPSLWASSSSHVKWGVWISHQNHLRSFRKQGQATHPGVLIELVRVGPSPRSDTELGDLWDPPSSNGSPQSWQSAPLLYLLN